MNCYMVALMTLACSAAGAMAGVIGHNGLSVASIDSIAINGLTKHIASVKHVAELPQQVVPVVVLPTHQADVQHDTFGHNVFPAHQNTFSHNVFPAQL